MAFNYMLNGVPDLDQKWDALPKNGANYCVPTAFTNWMYYYLAHGRANAVLYGNSHSNHIPLNIGKMGDYMDTDADDGTSSSDAMEGLIDWMEDRHVPGSVSARYATDNDNCTYVLLRNKLQAGCHIVVDLGRFTKEDGEFERTGGHAMTLVGLQRTDDGTITMSVHNPNNDSDINTQASSHLQQVAVDEKQRNIEGDHVTILRWGPESVNPPYPCIDGWMAIEPHFALTNVSAKAMTAYTVDIPTGKITTKNFELPFGGGIDDLALDPSDFFATVISKASGEVWTLNLLDSTWSRLADIRSAHRVTYGGRRQRLFVVQGQQIHAFDQEGKLIDHFDAGVDVDALAFDQKENRLIVATSRGSRLLSLTPALKLLGSVECPAVAGTGRLSLSVNGRDQTITLSRQGANEISTLRWKTNGALSVGRFRLQSDGAIAAVHVTRKGRMHLNEAGKIATFDGDGLRVSGSPLDGLPAGPLLKIARSSNALDEVRSRRKGHRN